MSKAYTTEELNTLSGTELNQIILAQQEQINTLQANYEKLIEQIRIANQARFGRHSEKLDVIDGQLSLFDEAEAFSDPEAEEPPVEEVVQSYRRRRPKGKREEDLKGFPEESHHHTCTKEELDAFYGEGNWRAREPEVYKRLRYEPASWTVEIHTVDVFVGTNGLSLSSQTMANWVISFSKYFNPLWERMKEHLLELPVTQADETPVMVVRDERPTVSKSYMWVYRSGELFRDKAIILYEYQKTRHHDHPLEFYKNYQGTLVTDGLQQYHVIEEKIEGLTNANCWAHARRDFADACKAMDKKNADAYRTSTAHQALELIGSIYHAEAKLKDLSADERLRKRKIKVKPLVEAFFTWVRAQVGSNKVLPKSKTMEGLNYCLNQEKYLKVFLTNGDVPIDNSASERAIRPFCLGKKNWVIINSIKGAQASAVCYSIAESAKANGLKPYEYFKYLLTELPYRMDNDGNIDPATLDDLMPWSKDLPEGCYKRR